LLLLISGSSWKINAGLKKYGQINPSVGSKKSNIKNKNGHWFSGMILDLVYDFPVFKEYVDSMAIGFSLIWILGSFS
jgi:hypothetical protein